MCARSPSLRSHARLKRAVASVDGGAWGSLELLATRSTLRALRRRRGAVLLGDAAEHGCRDLPGGEDRPGAPVDLPQPRSRRSTRTLDTRDQASLADYITEGNRVDLLLRRASSVSADDPHELATIARQRAAYRAWEAVGGALAGRQGRARRRRGSALRPDRGLPGRQRTTTSAAWRSTATTSWPPPPSSRCGSRCSSAACSASSAPCWSSACAAAIAARTPRATPRVTPTTRSAPRRDASARRCRWRRRSPRPTV